MKTKYVYGVGALYDIWEKFAGLRDYGVYVSGSRIRGLFRDGRGRWSITTESGRRLLLVGERWRVREVECGEVCESGVLV